MTKKGPQILKALQQCPDPAEAMLAFRRARAHGMTKAEAIALAIATPDHRWNAKPGPQKQTPEEKKKKDRERRLRRLVEEGKTPSYRVPYTPEERALIDAAPTPRERERVRSRLYYRRNAERINALSKDWRRRIMEEGHVPKKYKKYKNPQAVYQAHQSLRATRNRKEALDAMTEDERAAFMAQRAKWQRTKREKDPEAVRQYQREYHRKWAKENLARCREYAIRWANKGASEEELKTLIAQAHKRAEEREKKKAAKQSSK